MQETENRQDCVAIDFYGHTLELCDDCMIGRCAECGGPRRCAPDTTHDFEACAGLDDE